MNQGAWQFQFDNAFLINLIILASCWTFSRIWMCRNKSCSRRSMALLSQPELPNGQKVRPWASWLLGCLNFPWCVMINMSLSKLLCSMIRIGPNYIMFTYKYMYSHNSLYTQCYIARASFTVYHRYLTIVISIITITFWPGLDSMEDTPMVQLGDASTAAPFTTRTPSISSVVDIIRQGRCTLLSAVQQMLGWAFLGRFSTGRVEDVIRWA